MLGDRTDKMKRDAALRAQILEAGRQAAFAFTNVNWEQADADVQRILDAATGSFYDDMQRRAPSYTELVKQAQSVSKGDVRSEERRVGKECRSRGSTEH